MTGTDFLPAIFAVDVVDADMHVIEVHISIPYLNFVMII